MSYRHSVLDSDNLPELPNMSFVDDNIKLDLINKFTKIKDNVFKIKKLSNNKKVLNQVVKIIITTEEILEKNILEKVEKNINQINILISEC